MGGKAYCSFSLAPLFRRPKESDYGFYEDAIEIGENAQRELMSGEYDAMPSLDYWLWQMLANKVPLMLTYQGNSLKSQQLVLSLMNHIPKAMLRGMSLCSGTGRLMKYDGAVFDFQLTSEARRNIPKLNGRVSEGDKVEGWYKTIADSIIQDGIDIPMLINRFSDEIGIRNDALGAVVLVFSLVDRLKEPGEGNEQKFQLALRIMATTFPEKEQGQRFKSVILAENVTKFFFGEEHFIYQMVVTPYWRAFDYESFMYKDRVRAYVSSKEVGGYARLMTDIINSQSDNPVKTETLMQTVKEYSEEDCELLMSDYWNYYCFLAQHDSRMLNCKAWMTLDREKFLRLIQLFKNSVPSDFKYWDQLLTKMLWEDVPVDLETIMEIGPYCPRPFLGWEWDRCDMLRKGFAERVFNEDRGEKTARKFTSKSGLNKKLYKLVQKKYEG